MKTKVYLPLMLFFSLNLFAEGTITTEDSEVVLPDTVSITNELIQINQESMRDLASTEDEQQKLDRDKSEFWIFE